MCRLSSVRGGMLDAITDLMIKTQKASKPLPASELRKQLLDAATKQLGITYPTVKK